MASDNTHEHIEASNSGSGGDDEEDEDDHVIQQTRREGNALYVQMQTNDPIISQHASNTHERRLDTIDGDDNAALIQEQQLQQQQQQIPKQQPKGIAGRIMMARELLRDPTIRRKLWRTLLFIALWYVLSLSLSVFNKWLFSPTGHDFHFPLFSTMFQMWCQFLFSIVTVFRLVPRLRPRERPSAYSYLIWFAPCGVATGLDIGLSNKSLQFITLSFYTMVKSGSPMFVLLFAFLLKLEKPQLKLFLAILIICAGVVLMVLNETQFDLGGYFIVQTATVLSGFRWSLTQLILQHAHIGSKNPVVANLYLTPVMGLTMLLMCLWLEDIRTTLASPWFATWTGTASILGTLVGGSVVAFLMTVTEYQLISISSVVTMSIAGMFKEILTMIVSIAIFGDIFTINKVVGLIVSLAGIGYYNYIRIKDIDARRAELRDAVLVANAPTAVFGAAQSETDLIFNDAQDTDMFRLALVADAEHAATSHTSESPRDASSIANASPHDAPDSVDNDPFGSLDGDLARGSAPIRGWRDF